MESLFEILKKLFGFGSEDTVSSSLMEKARASALMSENNFLPKDLTSDRTNRLYDDCS